MIQETNEKVLPHVVEPSAGVDRIALAVLCEAYAEEWIPKGEGGGVRAAEPGAPVPEGHEARTVMRFAPCLAPIKAAVFPLLKNKPELVERAQRSTRVSSAAGRCSTIRPAPSAGATAGRMKSARPSA
jgi:glycyl-tRNA synthetase